MDTLTAAIERAEPRDLPPPAFDDVVAEHRRDLYRVAYRILGTPEDADEAVQETFVRAWRALPGFRGEASLRTWLTRIAINVARRLRARTRRFDPLPQADVVPAAGEPADAALRRREAAARVRAAVDRLPGRQREAVWLKLFVGLTHREAAAAMGLTDGAVKAHLHQAIANLRRILAAGDGRE